MALCNNNRSDSLCYDFAILHVLKFCNYLYICSMKVFRLYLLTIAMCLLFNLKQAKAQCAMCAMNAENSVKDGNTEGQGLNSGILYLLAAPYIAVMVVGFIWYKNYRKKDIAIAIKEEKINLN